MTKTHFLRMRKVGVKTTRMMINQARRLVIINHPFMLLAYFLVLSKRLSFRKRIHPLMYPN